jgi:hypothetical protein
MSLPSTFPAATCTPVLVAVPVHAITSARDSMRAMFDVSFVNITPFDALIHVEEVEKTPEYPPNQPVAYTSVRTVSLNSRST